MNLGIVGGRDFDDRMLFNATIHNFLFENKIDKIVTGDAPGADELARNFTEFPSMKTFGMKLIVHEANWKPHGILDRSAGFKRNQKIWKDSDVIIAFWDGKSKGTKQTIDNFKGDLIIVEY